MDSEPEICPDRAIIMTKADQELAGWPVVMRRAEAFRRILEGMRIYILPGELIVGNQASKPRSAPLFPEFGADWILEEIDDFSRRKYNRFQLNDEHKSQIIELCQYWKGKTHFDRVCALTSMALPESIGQYYDPDGLNLDKVLSTITSSAYGDGHIIADHEYVLKKGLKAVIDLAQQELSSAQAQNDVDIKKVIFLKAAIVSCEGLISFAERFAALAEELALEEINSSRRAELLKIGTHCRRVPAYGARTFHEALQSLWFVHLAIQIESNGHGIPVGRFDQYLYPFFEKDIQDGIINKDQAVELIECFWLKCCEVNKLKKWINTEFKSGYGMFQTLTIGGRMPRDSMQPIHCHTSVWRPQLTYGLFSPL